jgi:hypothetical protein
LAKIDQLPTKGSLWLGNCKLAGTPVETAPIRAQNYDHLVEDPSKIGTILIYSHWP